VEPYKALQGYVSKMGPERKEEKEEKKGAGGETTAKSDVVDTGSIDASEIDEL
jgi:hypothetical protein